MFRETDWPELKNALQDCAPRRLTDPECDYLKDAFFQTERMWSESFAQITKVRLVMLSEAPRFGAKASYFYNPHAPFTAFFSLNDAEAILCPGFAKRGSGKQFLLPELARAGFIILDVFPFAFNEKDTGSITYRSMSKRYRKLFKHTAPLFFNRKRDLILQHGTPLFVFRYSTTHKWLGGLVNAELEKRGIGRAESIGGTNMPLDREKLKRAWKTSENKDGFMDRIIICEARPSDASVIAEIHLTARREAMPYLNRPHTDEETRDYFVRVVGDRPSAWRVARLEEKVVGYMLIDGGNVDHLYVRPGSQRQGIGLSLLNKAKALSPHRLELSTFQRNTGARAFYEAQCFRAAAFTDGRNEENEPDVKYEWIRGR